MKQPTLFGGRGGKLPPPREHFLQMAVASHLRLFADKAWRWSHFPAGELRDKRTAAKLKAYGTQTGWPDVILLDPDGQFYGLELKREGETLNENQEIFQAWAVVHAVPYEIADNINDALSILARWGIIKNALPNSVSR